MDNAGPSSSSESLYDESLDARRSPPGGSSNSSDRRFESAQPLRYAFSQAFGEKSGDPAYHFEVDECDMLSSVRFNADGDMLATGDKGGRIVLLKRRDSNSGKRRRRREPATAADVNLDPTRRGDAYDSEFIEDDPDVRPLRNGYSEPPLFAFWTQFQSHEPEFDYLKSMEIEEKINGIRWCRPANGAQRLIATNDKMIKLWRVFEKDVKEVLTMTPDGVVQGKVLSSCAPPTNSSKCSPNSPWGFGKCMPPSIQQYLDAHSNKREPFLSSSPPLSPPSPVKPVVRPSFQELRSMYKGADVSGLSIPRVATRGSVISAAPRRVFSNSHAYHINSVSLSSDEETFLSADDLRINVWNLHIGQGQGFNIVDIKPDSMEDLLEVITCAEFHPTQCHIFMHSSSRGVVKMCDLRQNALCDNWSKEFEEPQNRSARSTFFSEIVASVSDIKFSPDGRYILTRDYVNLRLWDVNMEREPLLTIPVHEQLRPRLGDMYDNDCIFDKFQCAFSHDGGSLLTGSYRSLFQSYSSFDGVGVAVEASVDFSSGLSNRGHLYSENGFRHANSGISSAHFYDRQKRVTKLDAARSEPLAAVAVGPSLYLYYVPT